MVEVGKILGVLAVAGKAILWRGLRIGYNEVEHGITVGSPLTVYGELIYNVSEKTLRIDTPLAFLKDKMLSVWSVRNEAKA